MKITLNKYVLLTCLNFASHSLEHKWSQLCGANNNKNNEYDMKVMARTLSQGWRRKLFYRCVICGFASQSDFLTSLVIWVRLHIFFQAPAPKDSNLVAGTSKGDMKWGFQHPWYQYSFHVSGPLGSFRD